MASRRSARTAARRDGARRPPRALLLLARAESLAVGSGLERAGFVVEALEEGAEIEATREPPDLVLARRQLPGGQGAVAICLVRPSCPGDARLVLAELADGQDRKLAAKLGVAPELLASRLRDLLPTLSSRASLRGEGRGDSGGARGALRLQALLEDLEGMLIRLVLASSRSDREAAEWLGLKEATLRSKMRKRGIKSLRPRRRREP
jgi:hypothetical protein